MESHSILSREPESLRNKVTNLHPLAPEAEMRALLDTAPQATDPMAPWPPFLQEAASVVDVRNPPQPPRSHRKFTGPALVFAKKTFRRACQPFINELLRAQVQFNEHMLEALAVLHEELDRRLMQERDARAAVERRLEALERRIQSKAK